MASDPALEEAWRRFGAFSKSSQENQTRFLRLRRAILIVGLLVTAVALLSSKDISKEMLAARPWLEPTLRWSTFLSSLVLSGLFTVAATVDFGSAWVLSRRSAELLKSEIFAYRTRTGIYVPPANAATLLVEQLTRMHTDPTGVERFGPARKGKFPPRCEKTPLANGAKDDGLCALTAGDYQRFRIDDQIGWYCGRAHDQRNALLALRVLSIAVGLTGTVFAFRAHGWAAWAAVTTAAAAALLSWVELRRLEPTAQAYERAATDLSDVRLWWQTLTDAERAQQASFDKLVQHTEQVIQTENASWTQDMRKRVAELKAEAEQRQAAQNKARDAK